ncbi:serine hydrolase domain-containing protein [Streptosporangium sp. NPDC002544]|uniref:serine hydrolase domain-containing protein n=1 Tax=Streptosporangium sp. NPDC002544 TaxID=3154538 RepID=UPI0033339035
MERAEKLPRDFPPGSEYRYSNTDYIVLGMLIERVTGRPYATEIRERILRPLGLRHTRGPYTSGEAPGTPPRWTPGCRWPTSKSSSAMPPRSRPSATTAAAASLTVTPPTGWPPSLEGADLVSASRCGRSGRSAPR